MRTSSFNSHFKRFVSLLLSAGAVLFSMNAAIAQSVSPKDSLAVKTRPAAMKAPQAAPVPAPEAVAIHTRYTFTGKGSWFTVSNWENERMPPTSLKPGEQVVIDGTGPCIYGQAALLVIGKGSSVEIKPGKVLYLSIGDRFSLRGGTLMNNGELRVLSGTLTAGNNTANKIVNTGKITGSRLATIDSNLQQAPVAPAGALPAHKATSKQ